MNRSARSRIIVVVAATFGSTLAVPVHGQNLAPQIADTVPDRWEAAFDLGFNGSTGNTRLVVLTTGFRIKHLETERYELEWSAGLRYGESEGEVVARNLRTAVSFDLDPAGTWSPFLFIDAERDAFRRLDLRTNTGGGIKRTFLDGPSTSFSVSTALLHDYENFNAPVGDDLRTTRNRGRWSVRLKGHRLLERGIRFDHVSFFQPVVNAVANYNIDSNTKLTIRLSERVGVNLSYTLRRDSTPPPDIDHNDQLFQAGITIRM